MFTFDRSGRPALIALLIVAGCLWAAFGWGYALSALLGGAAFSIRKVRQ